MPSSSAPELLSDRRAWTPTEVAVLDAVQRCCERWGMAKTTIDDIARESGVSRATLYRMFPGGRDVVFEAHRVRELERFFSALLEGVGEPDGLHDLLARAISTATRELEADDHLAAMLASEPGEVISEMTVEGLPRIIRLATASLGALVEPYLPPEEARRLIDVTVRLVISYFLAPSDHVDLRDEAQAHAFVAPFLPDGHRDAAGGPDLVDRPTPTQTPTPTPTESARRTPTPTLTESARRTPTPTPTESARRTPTLTESARRTPTTSPGG